jgi:probable HAF family extracellular repeat protein
MKAPRKALCSLLLLPAIVTVLPGQPAQPHARFKFQDLGTLPGSTFSLPGTISDSGVTAGLSVARDDGSQHPVLWIGKKIVDLLPGGTGGLNVQAFGVNALGRVSIVAERSTTDPDGEDFCGLGTFRECVAKMWANGRFYRLQPLGGRNSTVGNVNNFGVIAGVAETADTDASCSSSIPFQQHLFKGVLWGPDPNDVRPLAPLPGDTVSEALWVNDSGQATGASGLCSNSALPPLAFGHHAVVWDGADGSVRDLGNLGSTALNVGLSINNLGQVVGASSLHDDSTPFFDSHGFLWTRGHDMVDLGTLWGDVASFAAGINDSGEIVGASIDGSGNPRAVYWQNNAIADLNMLVEANPPLYMLFGAAINNAGEIVGWGVHKGNGEIHAFKLTPNRAADGGLPALDPAAGTSTPFPAPASIQRFLERGRVRPKS